METAQDVTLYVYNVKLVQQIVNVRNYLCLVC